MQSASPRPISVQQIRAAVHELIVRSASALPPDYLAALEEARRQETDALGREMLIMLLDNADYARAEGIATCQDTGMALLFLEVGQDVHFTGGDLATALRAGVAAGYADLRKSVVDDPLLRRNTGDNTPPMVHTEIVPGNRVRLTAMMKGFGAELMSRLQMLPPAAGRAGVRSFVVETVRLAGPNACPPVIVGVGLGGSFDSVGLLAKRALLRPLGSANPRPHLAELEAELLAEINALGIGPQGFGGSTTALAVHVEAYATHMAALPVAVNLNCSAPRRAEVIV